MNNMHTVDIAHPPLRGADAERVLDEMLGMIKASGHLRGLKIIHGYGKSGTGGSLKQVVLNWAYNNRGRIKGMIPGEQYSVHDALTQEMRAQLGQGTDSDLDAANTGMTIIWVK
jgi:hypothetical protein